MTFYQIAVDGGEPSGPLFKTRKDAEWEIDLRLSDDIRYQDDAGGDLPQYHIHQVAVTGSPIS